MGILTEHGLLTVIPMGLVIEKSSYFGGIFNAGLFYYKNPVLDGIRLVLFALQRMITDPISYLLSKARIDLANKLFSPGILVVCRKK